MQPSTVVADNDANREEEDDKLEMGTFKLHLWREIHINLQVHPLLNTTLHSEAAFDTGIDFEGVELGAFVES